MKNILTTLFCVALLSSVLPAKAQKEGKLFSVGFGLEGGIPLNDFKNVYSGSGGMTVRFSFHAGPGFATFTTGGNLFIPKNIEDDNAKIAVLVPFKAGYKYRIVGPLFVMGELGYSYFRTYYDDVDGNLDHYNSGGFTYAPSIGVQFRVMEFAVRYENVKVSDGNLAYLGLRLGFNF